MSNSKKVFATIGISVLALGAIAIGNAQTAPSNGDANADAQILANRGPQQGQRGPGGQGGPIGQRNQQGQRGGGGFALLNAADGTTVTATFFTADPAQSGSILSSYNLVVGQDSERTFMTNVREAMETAAFATMTTGPQSRIVEIPQANSEDGNRRGNRASRGLRGVNIRNLDAGSTVQVSFFTTDPTQGASPFSSLSFTQGQSSESAFMESVQAALETASFVQINISQQVKSMDLAARRAAMEERAAERGERGQRGQRGQRGLGGNGGPVAPEGQTN